LEKKGFIVNEYSFGLLPRKVSSSLRSVKEDLRQKTSGVYNIHSSCEPIIAHNIPCLVTHPPVPGILLGVLDP
jgi:hypothetical protein